MAVKRRLGEMLIDEGLLTEEQLDKALVAQQASQLKLGQYLVRQALVSEEDIVDMLSRKLGIDKYRPGKYPLDLDLVKVLPADIARKAQGVPVKRAGHLLHVAMPDPTDIRAIDTIEVLTNTEVEPVICSEQEFNRLFGSLYGSYSDLDGVLSDLQGVLDTADEMEYEPASRKREADLNRDLDVSSLQGMAEDAPVVRLVNSILSQAVRERASDIHISPEKGHVNIRFRADGRLREVPAPPKSMFLAVISRLKILADMDIAVSRIPQDGRFTIKLQNREINIRASTIPTVHGENFVLRLLDAGAGIYTLDRLGMSAPDMEKIERVIYKPYGMILSTGPTGSGKSTSLYAILKQINQPDINIITLEDPVEYRVENVRQVQLNRKAGMTFASGLRSILRQDPDVIMVGEIRDAETAGIGVQAALTGHRVLSTVHTNDAAGAVTRLMDMGIEPFLVSSVLLVSFAQRLVRKVCPNCKEAYEPHKAVLEQWGLENAQRADFQRGRGCVNCMNTGYRGRTGVFEILPIDEMVQDMIVRRASAQEITRAARQAGTLNTLKEDAADKVLRGVTTIEEAAAAVMV